MINTTVRLAIGGDYMHGSEGKQGLKVGPHLFQWEIKELNLQRKLYGLRFNEKFELSKNKLISLERFCL